jgi:uncharacterized lipoprotein YmbA
MIQISVSEIQVSRVARWAHQLNGNLTNTVSARNFPRDLASDQKAALSN